MTQCITCRFFLSDNGEGTSGECRRHAPHPTFSMQVNPVDHPEDAEFVFDTSWPVVGGQDWCGEYQEQSQ